jgi:hypothetical protein
MSKDEREVIRAVIVSTATISVIAMHHARLLVHMSRTFGKQLDNFVVCTSTLS